MAFVLRRTVFGRHVVAIGSNERPRGRAGSRSIARRSRSTAGRAVLRARRVMQMSRLRQGDPTVAVGVELDVIAAVVIGGGSLAGGEGSVAGSLVGALIMSMLRNGCQQMGWPTYVQEIIIGVIIVLAVAADRYRASRTAE
jgi:ribose transport system permease protein